MTPSNLSTITAALEGAVVVLRQYNADLVRRCHAIDKCHEALAIVQSIDVPIHTPIVPNIATLKRYEWGHRRDHMKETPDGQYVRLDELLAALHPCDTCNGRGEIGGFVNAESGYQTDPCPDCVDARRLGATISIQEAWVAAGGNPGVVATRQELLTALRQLDEVCDEADKG